VRCLKIDWGRTIVIKRSFPACDADAPLIAGLKSRKAPFRMWRDEIVAVEHREIQEFARDLDAYGVQPEIIRASAAKAVAIKSSHRIAAAALQFRSKNVRRHGANDNITSARPRGIPIGFVHPAFDLDSLRMRSAIAYWLIPAQPACSFFEKVIVNLAERYDAPVFEPHVTVHVGLDSDVTEKIISQAAIRCEPFGLKVLEVYHSAVFTKTLFAQFAPNTKLQRLNEIIRKAAQDSSDYQVEPHLSLLYKKISIPTQRRLARSIKLPFSEVVFDALKAVRCVSPTKTRADVEAWRVLASKPLPEQGSRKNQRGP
jgi:hypothetical protein